MSTYLQLCALLRQNAIDSGTGPATVLAQSGELARFVQWIADAWTELQNEKDEWFWMRKSFTVNTVADDSDYAYTSCTDTVSLAAISRFSFWYKKSFKCYLQSAGVGAEYPLIWVEWEDDIYVVAPNGSKSFKPEFAAWMQAQAPEVKALADSQNARDAISMLDKYYDHRKAEAAKAKNQSRLAGAVQPKQAASGGPSILPDEAGLSVGYNRVRRA